MSDRRVVTSVEPPAFAADGSIVALRADLATGERLRFARLTLDRQLFVCNRAAERMGRREVVYMDDVQRWAHTEDTA